jgi:hypothetical protein
MGPKLIFVSHLLSDCCNYNWNKFDFEITVECNWTVFILRAQVFVHFRYLFLLSYIYCELLPFNVFRLNCLQLKSTSDVLKTSFISYIVIHGCKNIMLGLAVSLEVYCSQRNLVLNIILAQWRERERESVCVCVCVLWKTVETNGTENENSLQSSVLNENCFI